MSYKVYDENSRDDFSKWRNCDDSVESELTLEEHDIEYKNYDHSHDLEKPIIRVFLDVNIINGKFWHWEISGVKSSWSTERLMSYRSRDEYLELDDEGGKYRWIRMPIGEIIPYEVVGRDPDTMEQVYARAKWRRRLKPVISKNCDPKYKLVIDGSTPDRWLMTYALLKGKYGVIKNVRKDLRDELLKYDFTKFSYANENEKTFLTQLVGYGENIMLVEDTPLAEPIERPSPGYRGPRRRITIE